MLTIGNRVCMIIARLAMGQELNRMVRYAFMLLVVLAQNAPHVINHCRAITDMSLKEAVESL